MSKLSSFECVARLTAAVAVQIRMLALYLGVMQDNVHGTAAASPMKPVWCHLVLTLLLTWLACTYQLFW